MKNLLIAIALICNFNANAQGTTFILDKECVLESDSIKIKGWSSGGDTTVAADYFSKYDTIILKEENDAIGYFKFENGGKLIGKPEGTSIIPSNGWRGKPYNVYPNLLTLLGCDSVTIENIILDGLKWDWDKDAKGNKNSFCHSGIMMDSTTQNVNIINCKIRNVAHSGIIIKGSTKYVTISGCEIDHISWDDLVLSKIQTLTGLCLPVPTDLDSLTQEEYAKLDFCRGIFTHGIYVANNSFGTSAPSAINVESCTFHNIKYGNAVNIATYYPSKSMPSVININDCIFTDIKNNNIFIGIGNIVYFKESNFTVFEGRTNYISENDGKWPKSKKSTFHTKFTNNTPFNFTNLSLNKGYINFKTVNELLENSKFSVDSVSFINDGNRGTSSLGILKPGDSVIIEVEVTSLSEIDPGIHIIQPMVTWNIGEKLYKQSPKEIRSFYNVN